MNDAQTITAAQDVAGRQRVRTAIQRAIESIAASLAGGRDTARYRAYYEGVDEEVAHFRRIVADWEEG